MSNKIKKTAIIFGISLFGFGCSVESRSRDITSEYVLPPGFEDCRVYKAISRSENNLTLIACGDKPMSSIDMRVQEGKVQKEYIIIDGIRYKKDLEAAKK